MRFLLPLLTASSAAAAYVHPGLLHTASDFTRIISKLSTSTSPWVEGYAKLTANSHASPTWVARPQATVYRGTGSPENYPILYGDLAAAYALGLRWKISGNATFAAAAAAIVDAWSGTLVKIDGTSDKFLAAGLYGYQLANAVELLRGYSAWTGLAAAQALLRDVFYPMNNDFLVNHNGAAIDHYWSNWDLCNMLSQISIGIVTDNTTMTNAAISYFHTGLGNGALSKTVWQLYPDESPPLGQLQESGRDQGHTMLSVGMLTIFAQTAYNQGTDLFGTDDNRILKGAEYAAKYNLGNDVPYTTYTNSDVTQTVVANASRGDNRPIWELTYNHYAKVKGLETPGTALYAERVRTAGGGAEGGGGDYGPNSGGYDQLGYGTLMFSR
ncbi:chondroitin AC/alginate lyase [Geopyxis carbonaria]|nr:chondroitin AC/alginate lyase [Geopyxis carbonaria]